MSPCLDTSRTALAAPRASEETGIFEMAAARAGKPVSRLNFGDILKAMLNMKGDEEAEEAP